MYINLNNKILLLVTKHFKRDVAVALAVVFCIYAAPDTAFFWSMLFIGGAWHLNPRIAGVGSVLMLATTAVLLMMPNWSWLADKSALYALYLLCIMVVFQIIELYVTRTMPDTTRNKHTMPTRSVTLENYRNTTREETNHPHVPAPDRRFTVSRHILDTHHHQ